MNRLKKKIIETAFLIFACSTGFTSALANQDCSSLASTAAKKIYSLDDGASEIFSTDVVSNQNNTSNGVSLVVTLNGTSKYLVLLDQTSPGATSKCNKVEYVIAYAYSNLIRQ